MAHHTIKAETAHINLSPVLFRKNARDYFTAYLALREIDGFSPVPFFLCCRAIELALKAIHLESKSRDEVKDLYSHNLEKSYAELIPANQMLSPEEREFLRTANSIYSKKEFEYLNVYDAATAYTRFPDIANLEALARKITAYDA